MNSLRVVIVYISVAVFGAGIFASAANALTQERSVLISENCRTAQIELRSVYESDAPKRINMGQRYENIYRSLMLNLESRLESSGYDIAELESISDKYNDGLKDFRQKYANYHSNLKSLISVDCQGNPENFAVKLITVRSERILVEKAVEKLNEQAEEYKKYLKTKEYGEK